MRIALGLALLLACNRAPDAPEVAAPSPRKDATPAEPLRVAAAADLARAFEEVGAAFQRATGERVVFTFGSTGLLSKQIVEGAPFDVFFAANVSFVDDLVKRGVALADTKALYARGRLAVYVRPGATLPADLRGIASADFKRVAIANPEHAPYGRAARQALDRAGVLAEVGRRFVFGENVQQTQQFAETGNAEAAIISLSLAVGSKGKWFRIDESLHEPIDQAAVVIQQARRPGAARRFVAFVGEPAGREIMRRYGFLLPGEKEI